MCSNIKKLDAVGYLAYPEMQAFLQSELTERFPAFLADCDKPAYYGDISLYSKKNSSETEVPVPYWTRTVLLEPMLITFESIGEAARTLKEIQRNWAPYQYTQFRRASLIQEKLPYINTKVRKFPFSVPRSPIGIYTLIDEHTMLASAVTTSPLPAGQLVFEENHIDPPSRAYLKIQEALVRFNYFFGKEGEPALMPGPESRCLDAGACPGGWTWVLRQLGATVTAIDRAPLCDSLMSDPKVTFMTHDAFTLTPESMGPMDWVFSDVICYPERLLSWVRGWIESGLCPNMICTIKMQGGVNWDAVAKFAAIPGSRVVHLCYNKHELTWMYHNESN
ncbi:MAG: SAM-dependent methyltransferase [Treponemataceae bacterium]|nr:SAM-dependent methyltransferase [Treponemataceae bacterium]